MALGRWFAVCHDDDWMIGGVRSLAAAARQPVEPAGAAAALGSPLRGGGTEELVLLASVGQDLFVGQKSASSTTLLLLMTIAQ